MPLKKNLFCTCCRRPIAIGEVCGECVKTYKGEDFAPERYCNLCGANLSNSGGICDNCDSE
jgi:hypothetical protein